MGAHAAAPHQMGMYMLCGWWICPFSVSMSGFDLHCARPCANITKHLMFLVRHSMREASRLKL